MQIYHKNMIHVIYILTLHIANIFAPSHVQDAAKCRGLIAQAKQRDKSEKYKNSPNIYGIGIEVMGAISENGKKITKEISRQMQIKENKHN